MIRVNRIAVWIDDGNSYRFGVHCNLLPIRLAFAFVIAHPEGALFKPCCRLPPFLYCLEMKR